jgi:hypothetical protein
VAVHAALQCAACTQDAHWQDSSQGTSGAAAQASDDAPIFPSGLVVAPHASGCGVLEVTALTLRQGTRNPELYVALKNEGDHPACGPSFSVEVFDEDERSVALGLGGLLVRRFYRLSDGSGTLAACVGPGDLAMIAIRDLPSELVLEDVARVEYWCNFWALEVVPVDGLSVTDVRAVPRDGGVAYEGALVNGLDVPVPSPAVAVFPVNGVGRPLGVALGGDTSEVPPGGRWNFETNAVLDAGTAQEAYPAHGP